jgi:hypothetical protein
MHGISGSLVPAGFLEDVCPSLFEAELTAARRAMPAAALARWWRRACRQLGPASSARSVLDVAVLPLLELLGYEVSRLEPAEASFVGTLDVDGARIAALIALPWSRSVDDGWRQLHRVGRTAGVKWAIVCTGCGFQVVDASRAWARRGIAFDLEHVLGDEASLLTFWSLTRASGLSAFVDRVVQQADAHAVKVCGSLGDGVLASLSALAAALDRGSAGRRSDPSAAFEQALTVVYRILFLLFAEARAVVPTWHRIYREAYTIDALCRRSSTRTRNQGLWDALQAISRLAHAGCRAGDLQVTPFNGRLFSPRHTPLAEHACIADGVVRDAVLSLATGSSASGRRRIAYGDLGVEQLGAVYERVLEYEPIRLASLAPFDPLALAQGRQSKPLRTSAALTLARTSSERKATGSFYTPRSITEFLVRRTLHPLVDGKSADEILTLRVLDPAMGSGAFLVAACRYLARAAEKARIDAGEWSPGEVTRQQRVELGRLVAQRCLYGVDLNPMAVQLARLSLWLTTLATDRPLTFLDHHIASGDSLIGATMEEIARPAFARARHGRERRRGKPNSTLPLFDEGTASDMATRVLPDRYRLAQEPGDTPAAVRAKERTLNDLVAPGKPLQRWKSAADLWCAGWFWPDRGLTPGVYADLQAAVLQRGAALPPPQSRRLLDQAATLARGLHAFHWQFEFPEVFFDREGRRRADGGFDAVLGNPPWEVLRADTGNAARRAGDRAGQKERLRFFRSSGVYPLQGGGHPNQYQLFAERALQLVRPGGRLGLILPSGLATDHGSASLRAALFDALDIDRVFGFTNRDGIFPIHRDVRFLLLTGTRGATTERLHCRFGLRDAAWLDTLPDAAPLDPPEARPIVLSRRLLEQSDPDHLAIPELESARDLDILMQVIETIPKCGDAAGWNVRFGRELNATDDRGSFVQRSSANVLPVVEGKHVEPFRALVDRATLGIRATEAAQRLDRTHTFDRARIAYRDVASATNKLTLIAAVLPAGTVSTHTLFCAKTPMSGASQYCLLALMNSLVANYLVRLQVTTHVTASLMSRLPLPRPDHDSPEFKQLVALARDLSKTGIDANCDSYIQLNTLVARLYRLSREQYEHVVSTFPLLAAELRSRLIHSFVQSRGA